MRTALRIICLLVICASFAHADFLGIKKSSERITFRIKEPMDTVAGVEKIPDSVHIFARSDTLVLASTAGHDYSSRSTTYPFTDITNTPIDTVKIYGDTAYYFSGVLSNFVAAGNYQVTFSVDMYAGKFKTTTYATYQLIADSLTYDLKQARDSAGVAARNAKQANDTLALYDTRWDSLLAVVADANTRFKDRLLRIRDSVDVVLDTLQVHDGWVAKEASVTIVKDTLALYDTRWDSLLAVIADANTRFKDRLLRIRDSVDVILDTLQSQDGWVAQQTEVANIDGWNPITDNDSLITDKSSLGFITAGDSVVVDGSALASTSAAITATTIAADAFGASELATDAGREIAGYAKDSVWNIPFTQIDDIVGSVGDSAQGWGATAASSFNPATDSVMVDVSVAQASLLPKVVDSVWKSILADRDDVAGSFGDSAKEWGLTGASALDSGIVSRIVHRVANGTPQGSGADSSTLAERDVTTADILAGVITVSEAPNLDAAVSSRSTLVASDNIGVNWADVSNPTSTVGLTNTTVGIVTTTTTATNLTTNNDKTGYALTTGERSAIADSVWEANHTTTRALKGTQTVTIPTVTTVTNGVIVTTNNDKTGYALTTANNETIANLAADSTWDDSDHPVATRTVTVTTNNDKTNYALSTAGIDAIMEYDTSLISGAAAIATIIKQAKDRAQVILDSINQFDNADGQWDRIRDTVTAILAEVINLNGGSLLTTADNIGINWGDVSNPTTTVGLTGTTIDLVTDAVDATALATDAAQEMATHTKDSVWKSDLNANDNTAGSFADSAGGWGATAASSLDSGTVSRIMHRVGWGTPQGSGSDSSILAQRDVTTAAIGTDVITGASIQADAIGSSEVATDAIGAAEIAAAAITSSEAANLDVAVSTRAAETSVQIIRDTLALYDTRWDSLLAVIADANILFKNRLLRIRDSVDAVLDTLQNQDNWAAKEASVQIVRDTLANHDDWVAKQAEVANINGWNPSSDSVNVDVSVAQSTLLPKVTDSVWKSIFNDRDDVVGSFGDSAQTWGATGASSLDSGIVSRIVHRVTWGTAQGAGGDSSTLSQRDVTTADIVAGAITVSEAPNLDASVSSRSTFNAATDSVLARMGAFNAALDNDTTLVSYLRSILTTIASTGEIWTIAQRDSIINRVLAIRDSVNLVHVEVVNVNGQSFPTNFADLAVTAGTGRVSVGTNADKTGYTSALTAGEYTKIKDTVNQAIDNDTTVLAFLRLAAEGSGGGEVWLRPEVDSLIARMLAIRDSIALVHAEIVNVDGKVPLTPSDTAGLAVNVTNRVHDEDTTGHSNNLGDPTKMVFYFSRTGAGGGGGSSCGDSLGFTRTIVVIDTSAVPDVIVSGINIYFNNQPQSAEPYRVTTNNLGSASLGLNAGNWVRLHADARYLPETDSFTVAGVGVDTMRLCQSVQLDTDTLTTTVAFYIKKPNGTPNDSAAITLELVAWHKDSLLRVNNTIIAASYSQMESRADADGRALVHLYGNPLFTNDSSFYRATVRNRFNDKILEVFKFRVPVSDTVNYVNLLSRWKN